MPSENIFHWAVSNVFQWSNLRAFFTGSLVLRERLELQRLHTEVLARYLRSEFSGENAAFDFTEAVVSEACNRAGRIPVEQLRVALCEVVWELLHREPVIFGVPESPNFRTMSLPALHELRRLLIVKQRVLDDPPFYVDVWREKTIRILEGLCGHLSEPAFERTGTSSLTYMARLVDLCAQPARAVERTMATFYDDDVVRAGFFHTIRDRLDDNLARASGLTRAEAMHARTIAMPTTAKDKRPGEIVSTFMAGTPFADFFSAGVPFHVPETPRFSHQWILAPQGAGKTQLIQYQVLCDLPKVERGEASIVVMDSQGDLIRNIAGLNVFAPGQPLHDKLVLIEPDPDYPLALNLFDLGRQRLNQYSLRDQERLTNSTLELLTYVIGSLAGSEMTPKQQTLFRYVLRACMQIPDATINTFAEILAGERKYQPYIDQLEGPAKLFFELQFNDKQFAQTKQEVGWRLMYLLENPTFARMFQNPRSKLDLFTELQSSKVILINTDKDLLKDERTEMFGRFFIAMLLQSAQERAALDLKRRTPVFCYIDECHDYIAKDAKITTFLDQARKMNIGLILANQRCAQISAPVLDALSNVSIKMARALSDVDARTLARNMRTTPEFIEGQPERTFATSVRGVTPTALSVSVPFFQLEKLERMNETELQKVRRMMLKRYSAGQTAPLLSRPTQGAAAVGPTGGGERELDIRPSADW